MFLLGGAGLVLTRVPPACVLLCQRGRVSSAGEGGQGGTTVGSRAPGWGSGGVDNEQMNFCLPQPVVSGRDPRLSQPPIALPNCFCPHPLDRACYTSFPSGEQGPLSFTKSLVCCSPVPVLLPPSKAQTLSPPRTT